MLHIVQGRCEDGTVYALSLSKDGEFHGWVDNIEEATRYPTRERAEEILLASKISKYVFQRRIIEVQK